MDNFLFTTTFVTLPYRFFKTLLSKLSPKYLSIKKVNKLTKVIVVLILHQLYD